MEILGVESFEVSELAAAGSDGDSDEGREW